MWALIIVLLIAAHTHTHMSARWIRGSADLRVCLFLCSSSSFWCSVSHLWCHIKGKRLWTHQCQVWKHEGRPDEVMMSEPGSSTTWCSGHSRVRLLCSADASLRVQLPVGTETRWCWVAEWKFPPVKSVLHGAAASWENYQKLCPLTDFWHFCLACPLCWVSPAACSTCLPLHGPLSDPWTHWTRADVEAKRFSRDSASSRMLYKDNNMLWVLLMSWCSFWHPELVVMLWIFWFYLSRHEAFYCFSTNSAASSCGDLKVSNAISIWLRTSTEEDLPLC